MNFFRISNAALLSCLLPLGSGCSVEAGDSDTEASDLIGRVPGSSISSPNAKAGKTYLTVRRIDSLQAVGALEGVAGTLAARVDGIIANQPADGRFSIQELLQIEKPGFIETLFPEEKVALSKLWQLLETTNANPSVVAGGTQTPFAAVDISVGPGLIKPVNIAIPSLPIGLQESARRLELTHDADATPSTVMEADLAAAIATPGPYTLAEIEQFRQVQILFLERAGTTLAAKVNVPLPLVSAVTMQTWGSAKLVLTQSVAYTETRTKNARRFSGNRDAAVTVSVEAHRVYKPEIQLGPNQKLLVIDETTEAERTSDTAPLDFPAGGTVTVEIWSGGVRLGSHRAKLPALPFKDERIDLSSYADYQFVAGGNALSRNVVSAAVRYDNGFAASSAHFVYEVASTPIPPGADASALTTLSTPTGNVHAGRYEITVPSVGACQVDLYPEGVVRFSRPGGASTRSRLYMWNQVNQHDLGFPDRLRAIWNPAANYIKVFFDGARMLLEAPLTGALRTG